MPELIDNTAAYNALKHEAETHGLSFSAEAYDRAARIIDQMPTIEAEPVRHGRWVDVPDNNTRIAKCSLCGFWQRTNGDDKTGNHLIHNAVYRYCAGCGARMDGGADNGFD